MTGRRYTANLMKGGALVAETLALIREWTPDSDPAAFATRVVQQNLLGKATRARVRDIVQRVFSRRYLQGGGQAAAHIQALLVAGYGEPVLRALLYYYTALSEDLLYDFVIHRLFPLYQSGRERLDTGDALGYIDDLTATEAIAPPWSEHIRRKTARGLLAALRDFGVLEGKAVKRFRAPCIPMPVFLYVAHHLRDQGVLGVGLVNHSHWRLFLLDMPAVEQRFYEAHQEGHLGYYAAGGIVRVEWRYRSLEELVRALVGRADPALGG